MTDELNTRPMCWEADRQGGGLEPENPPTAAQCSGCAECPDFPYASDGGYDANGSPVTEADRQGGVLEFPNSGTRVVPVRFYPRNDGLHVTYNMLSLPKCTCGYQVGHKWGKHTQVAAGDKVDDEVAVSMECLICGVKVSLVVPGKL